VRPASRYKDEICGNLVVDDAVGFLERWAIAAPRPRFFLWVHFYEAHYPYARHAAYRFGDEPRDRYLAEVRYVDEQIGRLLRRLDELGLADTTAIVFTGDHGEEFGEHGGRFHATTLYDEILRVPLVVHVSGRSAELVGVPVGCGDLLPTLLRLSGHEPGLTAYGEDALAGASSRPQVARTRRPGAPLFEPKAHAVVHRGHKLLFDAASGVVSYFDLTRDPFEQRPLSSVAPGMQRELLEAMDGWLSAQAPTSPLERTPAVAAR
jgi:arylsulfatase A-like enzyme